MNDINVKSRIHSLSLFKHQIIVLGNSVTGQFSEDKCSAIITHTRALPVRAAKPREQHTLLSTANLRKIRIVDS